MLMLLNLVIFNGAGIDSVNSVEWKEGTESVMLLLLLLLMVIVMMKTMTMKCNKV
jgi:hypothetical protein